MKVAELQGAMLDYWVAKAEGVNAYIFAGKCFIKAPERDLVKHYHGDYSPSSDWSQGGPLVMNERISVSAPGPMGGMWSAMIDTGSFGGSKFWCADEPLIAAMRCLVASKYGEEVPDEEGPDLREQPQHARHADTLAVSWAKNRANDSSRSGSIRSQAWIEPPWAITDFKTRRLAVVFLVLRDFTQRDKLKDAIVAADTGMTFDHGMRAHCGARANLHMRTDQRIGANLHIVRHTRARRSGEGPGGAPAWGMGVF